MPAPSCGGGDRVNEPRWRDPGLLVQLVPELAARACRASVAAMLIGIPFGLAMAVSRTLLRHRLPRVRGAAADPAARLGAGIDHLLADAGAVDRLRHLPRRVLHRRDQRDRRRAARSTCATSRRRARWARRAGTSSGGSSCRACCPRSSSAPTVGIGITWEVVVAAEMISGGGSAGSRAAPGGGLGFFIWNSYVGGSYPQIVVGMISIGIAGYISSALRAQAGRDGHPLAARAMTREHLPVRLNRACRSKLASPLPAGERSDRARAIRARGNPPSEWIRTPSPGMCAQGAPFPASSHPNSGLPEFGTLNWPKSDKSDFGSGEVNNGCAYLIETRFAARAGALE